MADLGGNSGSREPDPSCAGSGPPGFDPGRELLGKVIDYYEGRKPYDFHRIRDSQSRANEAFDAWQVLAAEIHSFLGDR